MSDDSPVPPPPAESPPPVEEPRPWMTRLRHFLIGPPRDLADRSLFQHLSLIAFLAWVGLGSDGLSSSAYGPEEAFRTLGRHTYLALALAALMATTVLVISAAYSRLIEEFPHGGGGYVVATKLLGPRAGVVSGSALLVDYVLTITVSVAAAGDALFSLLPLAWHVWKLPASVAALLLLLVLNLRGVKESVIVLTPIFLLFVATHLVLIGGGILVQAPALPATLRAAQTDFSAGLGSLGIAGMLLLFIHAYSLGGGTYTGIEAVSNGVAMMREPRVPTAKRTMLYMAISLTFTATGLLLCYLLWNVSPVEGQTMNAALTERFVERVPLGRLFVVLTLVSEGALLVVAAQAGFVDGPRVLASLAIDSWAPRRFAALSDRLAAQNGVLLMGLAALAALLYTRGDVRLIVVLYSINVFATFSLSMLAMLRHSWRGRGGGWKALRRPALFGVALTFCSTILCITVYEKFLAGGWLTLVATGSVVALCFWIRRHYARVAAKLAQLYRNLMDEPQFVGGTKADPDPEKPVAVVLVAAYGGLGLHTFLNVFRTFRDHFQGAVFVSVGVIDSGAFKGGDAVSELEASVKDGLKKYVEYARAHGVPAASRHAIGTDAVEEGEKLCLEVARDFPHATFFAGKVLFHKEAWYQGILHNETAFALQKRLQWAGHVVVVVPARLV